MALINCSECGAQVSDKAEACPHCGAPIEKTASSRVRRPDVISNTPPEVSPAKPKASAPIFLSLAVVAFLLTLTTPRLLLFFPLMGTLGFAAVSFFRKEKGRAAAVIIFVLTLGVLGTSEFLTSVPTTTASMTPEKLGTAEIVDWNWVKDPSFGTDGTIKWNVQVKNTSTEYLDSVKVELTTYDSANKLIATTSSRVSAIPPGEIRSENGYMDLYGTEDKAGIQITDIRAAQ